MARTRRNPNGSYRMLGRNTGSIRMEYQQEEMVFLGDAINDLGAYEEIGTIEEFRTLKKTYGTKK